MTSVQITRTTAVTEPTAHRPLAWWVAVAMPIGPLAIGLLRYLLPYLTTDDSAGIVRAVAAHPGRESAVLWLGLVGILTLVPGAQAAARLAGDTRLARVALALVVPAYLCLIGPLATDVVAWSGAHAHANPATTVQFVDALHPSIGIALIVFVVGHIVGTTLIGIALLRSRRIPTWTAWALIVSQPLHFVAGIIVGSHALDLFAWCLTALGMAACAMVLKASASPSADRTTARPPG
jgi:hypothetical protein